MFAVHMAVDCRLACNLDDRIPGPSGDSCISLEIAGSFPIVRSESSVPAYQLNLRTSP